MDCRKMFYQYGKPLFFYLKNMTEVHVCLHMLSNMSIKQVQEGHFQ